MKRIKGGVLADGLNSALAAVFNSFPNSTFSQNNGVILLTGVASRYVGYFIAGMLVLLGLFPGVASFVQLIPEPVLGGATIVMFGTIAAAGVRIISRVDLDRRAILIMRSPSQWVWELRKSQRFCSLCRNLLRICSLQV